MCILMASVAHPNYSLIAISNRDEFFERKTSNTCLNHDNYILSPLDTALRSNNKPALGTWCGVNRKGRVAVILNLRNSDPKERQAAKSPISRGSVPMKYLMDRGPTTEWNSFEKFVSKYPQVTECEFNLFYGDCLAEEYTCIDSLGYSSEALTADKPYLVLSNDRIGSNPRWPKVEKAEILLQDLVQNSADDSEEELIEKCFALASNTEPTQADNPDRETFTSSNIFIPPVEIPEKVDIGASLPCGRFYGTRSQIVILVKRHEKAITFTERVLHDSDLGVPLHSEKYPKEKLQFKLHVDKL
ncbi:LAQU0S04e02696g1_1 [Lachancea quebecensis]|uniref:LAQU0S04e02696g1_1 n=1 Tax=Lachancea quebecensis TaxID=1654605 RepID=A0A0P1KQC2_9SACH|nr:LAQU0S04e02696g1_1 [Lachancea quebecensis]